jgi:lycopene beta-cyclase
MTDHVFPRRAGGHIMNIGTRGGRIKPSTGYAFLHIQQDSAAIVQSLLRTGTPFQVPPDSRRYRFYDSLMLEVMQRNGGEIKSIITAMFKNNPIERVFGFLDEKASPAENLLLIASLPPRLFLQAMFHLRFSPKLQFLEAASGTFDLDSGA